ncbi:hypothetical protein GC102_34740 [Paenibacillus sp. LMG 31460]|uniref:Uncharacterized protein n=1 Tax=Paenibacillus germinis TaxID=2654979 RepID=A0ABX1ZBZ5_9BACL|nr:hypothetical protein [Paenibacillus germinis]NOU90851.1 hypothetical protein [Paenibacillus germinis]
MFFIAMALLRAANEMIGFNIQKRTRLLDEIPMESARAKFKELGLKALAAKRALCPGERSPMIGIML